VRPDFAINAHMSWIGRVSLSPDGRSLVTPVLRATGDIRIAGGIQPPPGPWARLLPR
jgi:hypothetical protein